jgi:hypothetical protein
MSSKIIAGTTAGTALNMSADTSGILEIQTGSTPTTAIAVDASQNVTLNNVILSGSTVPANGMFLPTTNSVGFSTTSTERMRLNSSGQLCLGTTTYNAGLLTIVTTGNASASMAQTGTTGDHIYFRTSTNTLAGYITSSTGTTTSYASVSDYRLKENIVPMTGALAKISALKPCTYTWKADGVAGQGFIAHELQAVVPDCVIGEKDAVNKDGTPKYQGIDTSFLVATLTAAIQEQQALITDLQARLTKAGL